MKNTYVALFLCSTVAVLCLCTGRAKKDNLAAVGLTTLTQNDLDAFNTVRRYFPVPPAEYSVMERSLPQSSLIEIEACYKKGRLDPGNIVARWSLDWQWKKRYFTSLNYLLNVLQTNLGYSDAALKKYYTTHKNEFKGVVRFDSTGKACSTSVVKPFIEVKEEVADKMFMTEYAPDSIWTATVGGGDTVNVRARFCSFIRERGFRDFFINKFYKEKFGKPFPDSLKNIYGKGKYVTPTDMEAILAWQPKERAEEVRKDSSILFNFAAWLARWKILSEKAVSTGYASQPLAQKTLTWAWKCDIANRYLAEKVIPIAKKSAAIDTAMALYSYWDESGNPGVFDSAAYKRHLSELLKQEASARFDSLIYRLRRSMHVRFLQKDLADEMTKDPSQVLRQADSLRDTGNTAAAQSGYQTLVNVFPFTEQGKKALLEIAKLQTDQQSYNEAIKNYRRYLVTGKDKSKRCNTMFMIGFIYDEYLDKPEMAEANYKWVLKNTPECELADDAEFMMQHLGEQMSSVEELQAEVKRQGKKVEADAADSAALNVESAPAETAKKE